ncbi:MAG: glycosyltransferase family 1 protein [Solirubrobacterales bacterium]|nr:glycosyltransferase family 1 protein [Solirubrobacterales bacterium]
MRGMIGLMSPGADDLRRAAEALASRLPEPLAPLARIAFNYRWSWLPGGPELFESIAPHRWALCANNPVRMLQEVSAGTLEKAAADEDLLRRMTGIERGIDEDMAREPMRGPVDPAAPVAFFCAEYGVHASLPVYSGGLGALAGDILKESSDRALPLVAMGLMYHQGYFRQRIDGTGWQQEYWLETDPDRLPAALVTGEDDTPLTVAVPINGEEVVAQIWRVDVGRIPLYLLDAERPENSHLARWTSSQLYVGDPVTRLSQYVLLGVGGMRALRAMGIEPGVVHLNEGHAAFAQIELGDPGRTIFTTHTPVPAGNDTYPADQVREAIGGLDVDVEELIRLGRTHPDDEHEAFGVTQYALRTSRAANGVARRHGEVAREMWQPLWPDRAVEDVPIAHVTNGVHIPTWVGPPMRELLDRHLGEDWMFRAHDPATWGPVAGIPDEELWAVRAQQRATLVDYVRDRSALDRLSRGEQRGYVEAAARAFDPDVLTIGFARRVATYKRLTLLMSDPQRALGLLESDRPIQILIAGKAHPRDDGGKSLIQALFNQRGAAPVGQRVIFLQDYDLAMGARLTRGCDVWVNVPRPPLEASGTSGMKSSMNGGLNLSVLDGWWPEAYDGTNGWAISGDVDHDHGMQDHRDGAELYRLLEEEVVPSFYGVDEHGIPRDWVAKVKRALITVGPQFAAGRMVCDYVEQMYAQATAEVV